MALKGTITIHIPPGGDGNEALVECTDQNLLDDIHSMKDTYLLGRDRDFLNNIKPVTGWDVVIIEDGRRAGEGYGFFGAAAVLA